MPKAYSYYDKVDIPWGTCDGYEICKKLGRGKYSEVYLGLSNKSKDQKNR